MLKIKTLTMRNFMSIGAVTQSVQFQENELFLIIGENLDMGGNDNRNGCGKTAIINALSYALFGKPLDSIKLDNLVNRTNEKDMLVSVTFEKDGIEYTINRGRKPVKFEFYMTASGSNDDKSKNETQGEMRDTQEEIERYLGFNHNIFKIIVALNTNTTPFLSMKALDQREIIESLLGVTVLSEKAEVLKELIKQVKDEIKSEEYRIKAIKESNESIQNNIDSQIRKSNIWESNKKKKIAEYEAALAELEALDIDQEIKNHQKVSEVQKIKSELKSIEKDIKSIKSSISRHHTHLKRIEKNINNSTDETCPTCGQTMNADEHKKLHDEMLEEAKNLSNTIDNENKELLELQQKYDSLIEYEDAPEHFYDSVQDAYEHKASLDSIRKALKEEKESENPYTDMIDKLKSDGLKNIDYSEIEKMIKIRDHQSFLLKLLINKDSFIRKKIINQNLPYLNKRLEWYLSKINMPYVVEFQPDLTVDISDKGKNADFDNLSRGEKTRLILSLSWAFRDLYESLNERINLIFIDELLDNGLDVSGVESSLAILKKMKREDKKSIHLISHREELLGRVDNVLKVYKEGSFTTFDYSGI